MPIISPMTERPRPTWTRDDEDLLDLLALAVVVGVYREGAR